MNEARKLASHMREKKGTRAVRAHAGSLRGNSDSELCWHRVAARRACSLARVQERTWSRDRSSESTTEKILHPTTRRIRAAQRQEGPLAALITGGCRAEKTNNNFFGKGSGVPSLACKRASGLLEIAISPRE